MFFSCISSFKRSTMGIFGIHQQMNVRVLYFNRLIALSDCGARAVDPASPGPCQALEVFSNRNIFVRCIFGAIKVIAPPPTPRRDDENLRIFANQVILRKITISSDFFTLLREFGILKRWKCWQPWFSILCYVQNHALM